MNRLTILLSCCLFLASCAGGSRTYDLIPYPNSLEPRSGEFNAAGAPFTCDPQLDEAARNAVGRFAALLTATSGQPSEVSEGTSAREGFLFVYDSLQPAEGYGLDVTRRLVTVRASSQRGVLYAIQTMKQLLPVAIYGEGPAAETVAWTMPCVRIEDAPRFAYRGQHLDVSRHFFTADEVKRVIDIMALHKLNTLHWHLTDDQGWRLAIDKYPRLTEIGTVRAQTVVGHARTSKEYDGKPYGKGMFYTADDVREVLRYAADRYIDVIPEIEMPGHALAALAAYPGLGCRGEGYAVSPTWGVFDDVFCAGNDRVFEFMEGVLDEVIALFPSEYIHIGGDECPKTRWKECPVCQKRIAEEGLEDEHELQSYFMKRIERFVNSRGRRIIGWEEILEGGVSPTATVMSWKSPQAGIEAAKRGNKVIMVPSKFSYFDYYQSQDTEREPFAIGGYVPVSKVYGYDPYDQLDAGERKAILGVQANLWTEYISSMPHVEYMVLPRMAAMAENGWSYDRKDYDDFVRRMQSLRRIYDLCGFNYAKHIFIQN